MKTTWLLSLLLAPAAAFGQSYSIPWSTVGGGGGASAGGTFQITGTVGQPAVGATVQGGAFSITSGFWSLLAAVPAVGSPLLSITNAGGQIKISWPAADTGWVLQSNPTLQPGGWVTYSGPVNNNTVNWTPAAGTRFFRLSHP